MSSGRKIHVPGVPPAAAVVQVQPCQVRLMKSNRRFCFDPQIIKGIEEMDGGGVLLHLKEFDKPISIIASYEDFLDRCDVTPQVLSEDE